MPTDSPVRVLPSIAQCGDRRYLLVKKGFGCGHRDVRWLLSSHVFDAAFCHHIFVFYSSARSFRNVTFDTVEMETIIEYTPGVTEMANATFVRDHFETCDLRYAPGVMEMWGGIELACDLNCTLSHTS